MPASPSLYLYPEIAWTHNTNNKIATQMRAENNGNKCNNNSNREIRMATRIIMRNKDGNKDSNRGTRITMRATSIATEEQGL